MPAPALSRLDELGAGAPWPVRVSEAWARAAAASQGDPLGEPTGEPRPLEPGWWLARNALGGSVLFSRDAAQGTLLRCAEADAWGHIHAAARWEAVPGEAPRLAWARLRTPGGWLEIEPATARHALWGLSDRVLVESHHRASFAAQPWADVRIIPALDRPAALPPGAGESALNWLASLAADQGRERLNYRGPYPTAHLFDALRRSFRALEPEAEARARFSRDELALAWPGTMAESAVPWAPDPLAGTVPARDVLVRHRRALEGVWIGTVPFRPSPPGAALAGGARLWGGPELNSGQGGGRIHAGLVLLGAPYRLTLVLDPLGRVLEDHRGTASDTAPGAESGPPLDPLWREALTAWCAARAPVTLAPFVWELGARWELRWAPLPYALTERRGDTLLLQRGLAEQFRRLAPGRAAAELALMTFSDAAQGVAPLLRAAAQEALAEKGRAPSLEALVRAGEQAQALARQRLESALPRLIRELAEGRLLDVGEGA